MDDEGLGLRRDTAMAYRWIETFEGARQQELYELYRKEWWTAGRAFEDVMQMVAHSDITVGCCSNDENKLIGFARVLTDFTFKAMIFDVIVHDDFRGQGIGSAIIHRIIGDKSLEKVRGFELYCPDRLLPFYQKLGFAKRTSALLIHERQVV
jgi:GNAT superfamily N-acetyltransferase